MKANKRARPLYKSTFSTVLKIPTDFKGQLTVAGPVPMGPHRRQAGLRLPTAAGAPSELKLAWPQRSPCGLKRGQLSGGRPVWRPGCLGGHLPRLDARPWVVPWPV